MLEHERKLEESSPDQEQTESTQQSCPPPPKRNKEKSTPKKKQCKHSKKNISICKTSKVNAEAKVCGALYIISN